MAETTNITENGQAPEGDASTFMAFQQRRIEQLEAERREEAEKKEPLTLEDALTRLEPDPSYTPVYELRKINTKDFKTLIGMIRKVRNNEDLQAALTSGDQTQALSSSLNVLLEELDSEFIPWLADIAQMTPERFDEEHFGAIFDLLNDLKANDNFLQGVRSATYFVMTGKRLFGR